jgi:hypothetical protein
MQQRCEVCIKRKALASLCAHLQHALDDYGVIRCINYIRKSVAQGEDPLQQLQQGPSAFQADCYLTPVLENDALLFHDFAADTGAACASTKTAADWRADRAACTTCNLMLLVRHGHACCLWFAATCT